MTRYCAQCGIDIDAPNMLCQTCADAWGVDPVRYKSWPDSLRHIRNNAIRERRDEMRHHLSIERFIEDGVEIIASIPRIEKDTADISDGRLVTDSNAALRDEHFMRYAPYKDEAQNRDYRRANGIPERRP